MDRRWTGAMTLLVAVTLVLIGPGVGGRGVRGEASTAPLPGPPAVGDCLLREPAALPSGPAVPAAPEVDTGVDAAVGAAVGGTDSATLPAVDVVAFGTAPGGCSGDHLGEVVDVITDRAAVTSALTRSSGAERDARCRAAAVEYVGLRPADGAARLPDDPPVQSGDTQHTDTQHTDTQHTDIALDWSPALPIVTRWVGPDRLRRQAGQLWMACVLTPVSAERYRGTVRATIGGGVPPSAYGLCWPAVDLSGLPRAVDCAGPHRGQLMATGSLAEPASADFAAVLRSCRAVTARLMLRADPEGSGDLVVRTDPAEPPPARRFAQGPITVACFVATADDRELDGTLLGLGESAVRYAG